MQPDDVMLDLETLGTDPGCIILSVGAARFNPRKVGITDQFHVRLNVAQQVLHGAKPAQGTLDWWKKQSDDAKMVFLMRETPLPDALEMFNNFCGSAIKIWGNGPSFDVGLLKDLYLRIGMRWPFDYWAERDFRTVKDMTTDLLIRHGTFHNAMDDAVTQALHVQKVYTALGLQDAS